MADLLGYEVDVCIAPDDAATPELLCGAREIRRILEDPRAKAPRNCSPRDARNPEYDVATFTALSASLRRWFSAKRVRSFDSRWRDEGDIASVTRVARAIGWEGPLPGADRDEIHAAFRPSA